MWSSASFSQLHYDLSFHSPHSGCSADDGDKSCLPHVSFILFFDLVCLCLTTHTRPFPYPLTLYIDGTFSSSKSQSTSIVNLLLSALHRDPLWSPSRSSLPVTIPLPESEWTIGFATYDKLIIMTNHYCCWLAHTLEYEFRGGRNLFWLVNCSIPASSISAWHTWGSFLWMTNEYVNCAWWKCLFCTPGWFTLSHQTWQSFQGWVSIKSWHRNFPVMKCYCNLYKAHKFQEHALPRSFMHFLCTWLCISNYHPS